MSTPNDEHGLLGRLLDWLKTRVHRDDDLYALGRDDLTMMASDLGITETDLRMLLPKAADNSLLMERMMVARGLDPDRVRRTSAGLMRELELACARCGAVSRCRRDLDQGTAARHSHEYCLNAETFDELLAGA
jgi:hypothetical protein